MCGVDFGLDIKKTRLDINCTDDSRVFFMKKHVSTSGTFK
jgi:hypothetical protein